MPPAPPREPTSPEEREAATLAASQGFTGGGKLLYPHQHENVVRFMRELRTRDDGGARHGLLVADVPGLGKTMTALVAAAVARAETGRTAVVVVMPKSLVAHWAEELASVCPSWTTLAWGGLSGTQREEFEEQRTDVLLITHSELRAAFRKRFMKVQTAAFVRAAERVTDRYTAIDRRGGLFGGRLAAVIVDESHVFRNEKTLGFAAAAMLMGRAEGRLCLTGTPHNNLMRDVANQMCLVNGHEPFRNARAFALTSGAFLTRLHRTSLISHGKEFVDLPAINGGAGPEVRTVPMAPGELAAAVDTVRICAGVLHDFKYGDANYAAVLAQLMVMRRVAISAHMVTSAEAPQDAADPEGGGEGADADGACTSAKPPDNAAIAARIVADCPSKLTECLAILRALAAEGRKAAVFCSFVAPLMALRTLLEAEFGPRCAPILDGSLTGNARAAVVGRPHGDFFSKPGCRVLLATYSAGGVGLNLAPAADAVILLDTWWNPSVHQQAIDRIHRIGAVRPCSVYVLQHTGSFDTACTKLYHSFKAENGSNIMRGTYAESEAIVFGEGAAYNLLAFVADELGLADVAAQMQLLTGMRRISAKAAEKKRIKFIEPAIRLHAPPPAPPAPKMLTLVSPPRPQAAKPRAAHTIVAAVLAYRRAQNAKRTTSGAHRPATRLVVAQQRVVQEVDLDEYVRSVRR